MKTKFKFSGILVLIGLISSILSCGSGGDMTQFGGIPSSDKGFTITIQSDGNGSGLAIFHSTEPGELIRISAKAHRGYKFEKWEVVYGIDNVDLLSSKTRTPSTTDILSEFTMPANNVTLMVKFTAVPQGETNLFIWPPVVLFDRVIAGYAQPGPVIVGIYNSGLADAELKPNIFYVDVVDPSSAFDINTDSIGLVFPTIMQTSNSSFTVRPKAGLAVGKYNATVTIIEQIGSGAEATFKNHVATIEFEVVKPYTVTMVDDGFGTAFANPDECAPGTLVTINAVPGSGYMFKGWVVVSGNVNLSGTITTSSTFTMPQGDVTIKATFELIPVNTPTPNLYLSPAHLSFGSLPDTYTPPAPAAIAIHNSGTGDATITNIALSGTNAGSFTLTHSLNNTKVLALTGTALFTVQPKANLGARTHRATVAVTYDGGRTAQATIEFEVVKTYTITTQTSGPGTATAIPDRAVQGASIAIDAAPTPGSGYGFKEWLVETDSVTLANTTIANGRFTMPGEDVTLIAVFVPLPPGEPELTMSSVTFDDLKYNSTPVSKTITIKNEGSGTAIISDAALGGLHKDMFTISLSNTSVAAGASVTLTLTPKPGLDPGLYDDVFINLTYGTSATGGTGKTKTTYISLRVIKGDGGTVGKPTLNSQTHNSITINAVAAPVNGQTVEYLISTSATYNGTGTWQDTLTFTGLGQGTTYYVYARSVENGYYNQGAPVRSDPIMTFVTLDFINTGSTGFPIVIDDILTLSWTATTPPLTLKIISGPNITFTVSGGSGYESVTWIINGVTKATSGTSYTLTRGSGGFTYLDVGTHSLTVEVQIGTGANARWYSKEVTFVVVNE